MAFDDMLDTRERAYAERVPQADAVLDLGPPRQVRRGTRDWPAASSTRSKRAQDVAALGTAEERDQWARIVRLEAALLTAPNDEETNVIREKTRLAKGVLYWRLAESFKARVWNERRTLKDLDQALREAQNRWVRVQKARGSMPNNTGEFAGARRSLARAARRRAGAARRRREAAERPARSAGAQRARAAEGTHRHVPDPGAFRAGVHLRSRRASAAAPVDRAAEGSATESAGRPANWCRRRRRRAEPAAGRRHAPRPPTDSGTGATFAPPRRRNEARLTNYSRARWPRCAPASRSTPPPRQEEGKDHRRAGVAPGGRAARPEGRGQRRARHGQLPALPRTAEDRSAAARRSAAPPRRPQHGSGRGRSHGGRSVRRSTRRAPRPSSCTPACSRVIPTIRATTRCSTSWRAPTKPRASPKRRWPRSMTVLRRYPRSPQMDEVQFRRGELLFSARQYRTAQDAYRYVVEQGRQGRLPHAEPVQTRLVAVQAGPERRQPAVVRRRARSHHARARTRKLIPLEKLPRANRELADDTLRVMAVTFSYDDDSVAAIDKFLVAHNNPRVRAHPLLAPRRPVRREGALPGRGRRVPRLRHARAEQRVLARPVDAGHRGLSQGRLHRSWCSRASANTWRCTTTARTFWQGRNKADYPNIAKELKTNLKDVATYFHAKAQKIEEGGRVPRGGALVSHLSRILPGRSGFLRH